MNREHVKAVTEHPIVEAVLERHRDKLGQQMLTYRNHVYRCITYQQLLVGDAIPDFATLAWATHDLGIWTAGTFDYLGASADLASLHANEFGINDVHQARRLITEHHRLRPADDPMTDTFRRADLVDVSRGLIAREIGRSQVQAVVEQLPYIGFHAFLARGLTSYAVRHPLRPLPMLRW